jgi:uncharacterized protein
MMLTRIGPSSIDREGLFARMAIKAGTRIIQYFGEKISRAEGFKRAKEGNAYIFELDDKHDIDGKSLHNLARYINHSCDPNCVIEKTPRTLWVLAVRDIQEGEELSYDYGYEVENYKDFPCNCGAQNCCGYIIDREYLKKIQSKL